MPKLYQTDSLDLAVRQMVAQNDRCIIYDMVRCHNAIRPRFNLVADIPSILCTPWDELSDGALERWGRERGLLYYKHALHVDKLPPSDAMYFHECPHQYQQYVQLTKDVGREVIIYKPPSWRQHEAAMAFRYPPSGLTHALLAVLDGLRGRALSPRQQAALDYSGFPPDETTVFSEGDILMLLGINEKQLRMLTSFRFRGFFIRYNVYLPHIETEDDPEMYQVLLNEPDVLRGVRMLRFNEPRGGRSARVHGFKTWLKRAVKTHHVERCPDILLFRQGFRRPNFLALDAIANAHRGDWYRMKNMVEEAEKY